MKKHGLSYLLYILLLYISSLPISAQTKVIAHRGYWKSEGSAQNSLASLHKAYEAGAYGSEFDVVMTFDGIPVVNHDDNINGLIIADTPYKKLKNIKLGNGEKLPTLEDYLILGKKLNTIKLILEIKSHKSSEIEDKTVKKVVSLVKKHKMENQVEYISFSLHICKRLKELTPDSQIAYLNGDRTPEQLAELKLTGLDYHYTVFRNNPGWISEAQELGLTINAWTVNEEKDMRWLISNHVDYITTDEPAELLKIINE